MPASPAPADPGRDDDLAWLDRDPMTAAERQASLDRLCEQDEGHLEDEPDEYGGFEPFTAEELAEIRHAAADDLLAVEAATTGRRGPGQPGSARVFPGQSSSPAAAFGPGMPLDVLPGCPALAVAADAAAGEDDRYAGVSEAELLGVVCAWDRVEAHAGARKLAAIAELARRNPAPEDGEFTADQVAYALGESRGRAGDLVDLAQALRARLPGTMGALEDGTVSRCKVEIIARATALLDDAGARAAEDKVLDRAGRLTPGGLRAAIAPWLARDLAAAAARNPKTTWCVTVTDEHGHAVGHGCARPEPRAHTKRAGSGPPAETGFTFSPASRDGPPGGHGTWRLRTPGDGPGRIITVESLTTSPCDHRHQSSRHDPGVRLRHLIQVRYATCTSPVCRRPAAQCDVEHNTPYEAGGRTCRCNTGPKCRHDHRLKQHPRWTVDQLPDGTSAGPPRQDAPTPPNPPDTRYNPRRLRAVLATAALPDVGLPDRFHSQHG
jgi:Domain of unknown function (DUF222)